MSEPTTIEPERLRTREGLVEGIIELTRSPVDERGVAATLESQGLRDVDATERFGVQNLFQLADDVYDRCRSQLAANPPQGEQAPTDSWVHGTARFFLFYARGIFFALPMVVQTMTVVVLRLTGYLTDQQATMVALGTILSFIITGGFVQSTGRLALFYRSRRKYRLVRKASWGLVAVGLVTSAALIAILVALDVGLGPFPRRDALVAAVYAMLLSILWLSLGILYALQRRGAVLTVIVTWTVLLFCLLELADFGVYAAQWTAIGFGIVTSATWSAVSLARLAGETPKELERSRLPRRRTLVALTGPFFAYGVLYFCLLFLDRLVAWSADGTPGFPILFRRAYELGLNWALLSLLLTTALLDVVVQRFARLVIPTQKRFLASEAAGHNRFFERFYAKQLGIFSVVAVISGTVTYEGLLLLRHFEQGGTVSTTFGTRVLPSGTNAPVEAFFTDPVTTKVFFWAALGYALLVWGLMNAGVLFFLSRPGLVLRALIPAIAVDLAVGLVLSRTFDYWTAVIGLTSGALLFALLTTRSAIGVLRRFDYYYYSSY